LTTQVDTYSPLPHGFTVEAVIFIDGFFKVKQCLSEACLDQSTILILARDIV